MKQRKDMSAEEIKQAVAEKYSEVARTLSPALTYNADSLRGDNGRA